MNSRALSSRSSFSTIFASVLKWTPLRSHLLRFSDGNSTEKVKVIFITKDGQHLEIYGKEGDNVLRLAQENKVEIEGACEASLACCTCHVYVREDFYEKLEPAEEKEEDMLDMASFLKPNSRLSCQINLTKLLDGIEITLPPATRNFYVDGKKPTPH